MTGDQVKRAEEIGRVLGMRVVATAAMDSFMSLVFKVRMVERHGAPSDKDRQQALAKDLARLTVLMHEVAAAAGIEGAMEREVEGVLESGEQAAMKKLGGG